MDSRKIMLIGAVLLVIVTIPGRIVMAKRSAIASDRSEIGQANDALEARILAARTQQSDVQGTKVVDAIKKAIPADASIDKLLDELLVTAVKNSVRLDSASPKLDDGSVAAQSTVALADGMKIISVGLTVVGPLNGIVNFVEQLREIDRLALVDSVGITPAGDGRYIGTIPIRVFTWTPPSGGAVTAPTTTTTAPG